MTETTTSTPNIFEQASRQALRFPTAHGNLMVEDLWNLPITSPTKINLISIRKQVRKDLAEATEVIDESFGLKIESKADREEFDKLALQMATLNHIIETRVKEMEAAELALHRAQRQKKIQEVIAQKEDSALLSLTVEELKAMLND